MIVADVLTWVFIILGFLVAFPATWLLLGAVAPDRVERARIRSEKSPLATFFAGVGTIALFGIAVTILSATGAGPVVMIAVVLAGVGMGYSMMGISAITRRIGSRLYGDRPSVPPWRVHLLGGVVLAFSYLLPVLGWFVVLPLSLIMGAGAVTLTLFSRKNPAPRAPAPRLTGVEEPVT